MNIVPPRSGKSLKTEAVGCAETTKLLPGRTASRSVMASARTSCPIIPLCLWSSHRGALRISSLSSCVPAQFVVAFHGSLLAILCQDREGGNPIWFEDWEGTREGGRKEGRKMRRITRIEGAWRGKERRGRLIWFRSICKAKAGIPYATLSN